MSKYLPYPEYKSENIGWDAQIPHHWIVAKIKRGYEVRLGKMLNSNPNSPLDVERPYIRAANIQWKGVDTTDINTMWFSLEECKNLTLIHGDLLISEGGDVGRASLWKNEIFPCYFQNSINRVRSKKGNCERFLFYWIRAIKDARLIDIICNKATISHFTAEKVQETKTVFPPPSEQIKIASFLDRETAHIDALIEKKQRLIELLQEKRQSIITRAVTKGLDPNVPMKDSGVEWLGEVPAHWEVKRAKYLCQFNPSKAEVKNLNPETEVQFLPMELVGEKGKLVLSEIMRLDEVYSGYTYMRDGDVIVAKITPCFENGKGALIKDLHNGIGFGSTEFHVLRPQKINAKFLWYLTHSEPFRTTGIQDMTGVAGQKRVPESFIANFPIAYPEDDEQRIIVRFLDKSTRHVDQLISKINNGIGLLQERRSALITAAVTGQIDVRGEVA